MKKGQVATEYLVIVGFALLALVPLLIMYATERSQVEGIVNSNQARQIAREIVDASESVYYLGPPSKTTLKVYMPNNVQNVDIRQNAVVFTIIHRAKESNISEQSLVNMSGSVQAKPGIRRITIEAHDGGVFIS